MSEERAIAFVNRNHPHNDKDDFRTPQYLFSYIDDRYSIEYDGACTPGVNNLALPLRLEDDWPKSSVVYSNPPYDSESMINWFWKGEKHKAEGGVHIMLIPNKLSQCFMSEMIPRFDERARLKAEMETMKGSLDSRGGWPLSDTQTVG